MKSARSSEHGGSIYFLERKDNVSLVSSIWGQLTGSSTEDESFLVERYGFLRGGTLSIYEDQPAYFHNAPPRREIHLSPTMFLSPIKILPLAGKKVLTRELVEEGAYSAASVLTWGCNTAVELTRWSANITSSIELVTQRNQALSAQAKAVDSALVNSTDLLQSALEAAKEGMDKTSTVVKGGSPAPPTSMNILVEGAQGSLDILLPSGEDKSAGIICQEIAARLALPLDSASDYSLSFLKSVIPPLPPSLSQRALHPRDIAAYTALLPSTQRVVIPDVLGHPAIFSHLSEGEGVAWGRRVTLGTLGKSLGRSIEVLDSPFKKVGDFLNSLDNDPGEEKYTAFSPHLLGALEFMKCEAHNEEGGAKLLLELGEAIEEVRSGFLGLSLDENVFFAGLQLLLFAGQVNTAPPPNLRWYEAAVVEGLYSPIAIAQACLEIESRSPRAQTETAATTTTSKATVRERSTAIKSDGGGAFESFVSSTTRRSHVSGGFSSPSIPSSPSHSALDEEASAYANYAAGCTLLAEKSAEAHVRASQLFNTRLAAAQTLLGVIRGLPGVGTRKFFAFMEREALSPPPTSARGADTELQSPLFPPWAVCESRIHEEWVPRAIPVLVRIGVKGLLVRPLPPLSVGSLEEIFFGGGADFCGSGEASRITSSGRGGGGGGGGGGGSSGSMVPRDALLRSLHSHPPAISPPPSPPRKSWDIWGAAVTAMRGFTGEGLRSPSELERGWLHIDLGSIEAWGCRLKRPIFSVRSKEHGGVFNSEFTTVGCREMSSALQEVVFLSMLARRPTSEGFVGGPALRSSSAEKKGGGSLQEIRGALSRKVSLSARAEKIAPLGEWTEIVSPALGAFALWHPRINTTLFDH